MVQIEGFAVRIILQGFLPDSACSVDDSVPREQGRMVSHWKQAPERSELTKFP